MTETDTEAPTPHVRRRAPTGRPAAAARRQRLRRRRSAVLLLVLVLGGTVIARALEDPADIRATDAAQLAAGHVRPDSLGATASGERPQEGSVPAVVPTTPAPVPGTPTGARSSASGTAPPHGDVDSDGSTTPAPDTTDLPVPSSGTGQVAAIAIPAGVVVTSGRAVRYSVEVEGGLPVSSTEFARTVMTVLTDPRGWQTRDGVRFVPVSPEQLSSGAPVDVRVTLASPSLTARLCAPLDVTVQQVSCWNGSRSVLNLTRWMHGSVTYGSDLTAYRTYLISHEVGHGLGHGHVSCPASGRPAPVMVQQTKSLEGCAASPWPGGT